jgi:hypothetical protein
MTASLLVGLLSDSISLDFGDLSIHIPLNLSGSNIKVKDLLEHILAQVQHPTEQPAHSEPQRQPVKKKKKKSLF